MAEESDGMREAFDDALRVALTVATQLGEKIARLREQFARQREARSVQTNRELESRFEAERGAMRASLVPLRQESWWDRATVTDIANARETAAAWGDYDDVARETNDIIEREVQERYGLDLSEPVADASKLAEALRTAESERAEAAQIRERDGGELAAADVLLLAADRRDREALGGNTDEWAAQEYDSHARREEFAASLIDIASPETIAARILADGENARHPRDAVISSTAPRTKSKGAKGTQGLQRQRTGIESR